MEQKKKGSNQQWRLKSLRINRAPMIFYSFTDILAAYKISKETLKQKVKAGSLFAERLIMSGNNTSYFKYIVPKDELWKLEKIKQTEPIPSPESQPEYQIMARYEHYKKSKFWELYRAERGIWGNYAETEKNLMNNEYYNYLQSQEYQKRRLQRLKLDGFQCQLCGTAQNLVVHHITYDRIGREDMDDLITLCNECHHKVHYNDNLRNKQEALDNGN